MDSQINQLNLARKWRPKKFSQVVGQDFSVRILKNSLYLNKVFPVYIFGGQRGCGKTSTARIFGAALNCEKLVEFRKNPKEIDIPCLECTSCGFMQKANHPDFIEIDAASNTGVDNVRQIIDSAAHMPISGSNKIYLIDEAHMLSKAAFNAFLKILEEPPAGVHFILATTDLVKIPDTVRSRAFQVFFNPVENNTLIYHLKMICESENLLIDDDALELIVEEAEGTIRDSQNLLERVRFLGSRITKGLVLSLLGRISEESLIQILDLALEKQPQKLLSYLISISFNKLSSEALWESLVDLCRILIWVKYEIEEIPSFLKSHREKLEDLANKCSINRLNSILQLFWLQEDSFFRTSKKHAFLEVILLQICNQVNVTDLDDLLKNYKNDSFDEGEDVKKNSYKKNNLVNSTAIPISSKPSLESYNPSSVPSEKIEVSSDLEQWNRLILKVADLKNLMLESIFKQMQFFGIDSDKKVIRVSLKNKNKFFENTLSEFKEKITEFTREIFVNISELEFIDFSEPSKPSTSLANEQSALDKKIELPKTSFSKIPQENNLHKTSKNKETLDTSDADKWPQAHLLTKYFSGRIEQSSEN